MPLYVPAGYGQFKMVSFDPGLNNTGVCAMDIDSRTGAILSIEASTLRNNKLCNWDGLDEEVTTERMIKLFKLKTAIVHVLANYNPVWVGCEAPFFNSLMPMAFGYLLEVVSVIHGSVIDYNPNIPFELESPQSVKKSLGVAGKPGKEVVLEAMRGIPEIMNALRTPIETLDEHAIDSVAVGYSIIQKHRLNF